MGGVASSVQTAQTSGQGSGKGAGSSAPQPTSRYDSQPMTGFDGGGKSGPVGQAVQQVSQRADGLDQNAINADPQGFQQWQQQRAQQPQPMGKGGVQTNSATSGQPRIGQQNQYSNTVGQWDNTQQQQPQFGGGKGKG